MMSRKSASGSRHIGLELLSVLRGTDAGIAEAVVWFAAGEFDDADRHLGPRLLLVLGDEIGSGRLTQAVTVRLTRPPEVLGVLPLEIAGQVESFVAKNRDALLRHWHGKIDTRETLNLLEKVHP
jgi:hypothetical protein